MIFASSGGSPGFTYCRTCAGWVFVPFVVDAYAQRILGWHASTTRMSVLVLTCSPMAVCQREVAFARVDADHSTRSSSQAGGHLLVRRAMRFSMRCGLTVAALERGVVGPPGDGWATARPPGQAGWRCDC